MHGPRLLAKLLTKQKSKVMISEILKLKIASGSTIIINNTEMRQLTFTNGIHIVGHVATLMERKVLSDACRFHNLDDTFAKILVDAVVRFTYPHVGGAVMKMDSQIDDRQMFHPQQVNFLLEENSIPLEKRNSISAFFMPQEGWHCLDIGAFLGHGATWLRKRIGSDGKIICIEGKFENSEVIKKTMELNNFENVVAKNAAIWHTAGKEISFNLGGRQANAVDGNVVDFHNVDTVLTTSIKLLTEELGTAADFVSLTVNGAEIESLESLREMDPNMYPKRIIAPAWYPKAGQSRLELIIPLYEEFGYNFVYTEGLLTYAWLGDL